MKTTFEIEKLEHGSLLRIDGELTAQSAGEFRDRIIDLLNKENAGDREISLQKVTSVDPSALQLLFATRVAFQKVGKGRLVITGPEDANVASLVARTGFTKLLNF